MTSLPLLSVPVDSTEYTSVDDLLFALHDWAVKLSFTFRTERRTKHRASWICAFAGDLNCKWRVRGGPNYANLDEEGEEEPETWTLIIEEGVHTCVSRNEMDFHSATSHKWLDTTVTRYLTVTKDTKPKAIQDMLLVQFGRTIGYKAAQLCRLRLVEGDVEKQRESFRLLPAYCAALEEQAPGVMVDLVTGDGDRFERIFVCPPVSRATFRLSRRIIASDGTFLKARFILVLLLAVGVDANGETVVLAWAVVESGNRDSWEWFLRRLQRSSPEMIDDECTFISDRDKGLLEAQEVFGPEMTTAWCTQHLKTNFTDGFGRALKPLFWEIARARTEAAYNSCMDKLRAEKAEAAAYLEAASPHKWAAAFFPGRRYGHDTSNIVESVNRVLKSDCELAIIPLLDAIWHKVMAKRHDRLQAATKLVEQGVVETPFLSGKIEEQRGYSRQNNPAPSSNTVCRVVEHGGNVHIINTAGASCTCGRYQENGIPCGDAISAITRRRNQAGRLDTYLPTLLKAETWAAMYAVALPPIVLTDLVVGEDRCEPPKTRVPRGRPQKERIQKEDARRSRARRHLDANGGILPLGAVVAAVPDIVRSRCGTCGQAGHNARRCRQPHE